jgi:phasin family protein
MSEVIKTAETTRKAQEQAARTTQTGVESTPRATRETAGQTAQAAETAADRAKQAGHSITETVAETASAAADISTQAAASGRDAILMGMRTAAGVGGKVAAIGFGRGHHLLRSTVQALDIYTDATERSAERVQALVSSAMAWTRGVQKIQHAWLEMIDHSMERAAHRPQDLLRCKTLVEAAEVQRDLYTEAVNYAFESSSRLLELASRAAQDAVKPLQSKHH